MSKYGDNTLPGKAPGQCCDVIHVANPTGVPFGIPSVPSGTTCCAMLGELRLDDASPWGTMLAQMPTHS